MSPVLTNFKLAFALTLTAGADFCAAGVETETNITQPLTYDNWRYSLAIPGWLAGLEGDMGIDNAIAAVDVDTDDVLRSLDMTMMVRGEANHGRFGVTGELIALSLSDSTEIDTVVRKVEVRVDEIIGDLGVRWRVLENERDYLDVTGGIRYVNLYQKLELQADSDRIDEVSGNLVDAVGNRLQTALSESELRGLIEQRIGSRLTVLEGRDPTVPVAPLAARERTPILNRIQRIIDARKAELADAIRDRADATTDALRAQAQARIDGIKRDVSRSIANHLESKLDTTVSRTDDWFDPYVGLHGRYHFTDRWYFTGKGDVGGFGIGSDFTWQVEAALGWQITPRIYTEIGYRALGMDYHDNGLTFDTVTHGAQITIGMTF